MAFEVRRQCGVQHEYFDDFINQKALNNKNPQARKDLDHNV